MRIAKLLLVVCFFLAFPGWLQAQTATGGVVSGAVTDPSAAVIAGAKVELVDTATNAARTQQTNAAGQYVFANVPPGEYKITVSMSGFRQTRVPSLRVEVAKSYVVDVALEIGAVAETVDVTAEGRTELQTSDATIGNVLTRNTLGRLPALTRVVNELLTLQPAVTPGGEVAGARSDQSTFSLDGIDVTNQSVGGLGSYMRLPVDSVEEVRVSVANPNAAFGRGAGGQMSVISRRGSNDFHGALFWYHQNDNLNANSWTNNRNKVKEPELKDNRFGATFGGPVWRDKTFFFLNYEGRRFPRSSSITRTVPNDTLRRGILRFEDASGVIREYTLGTSTLCGPAGNQPCDPRGVGLSPTISALWQKLPPGNDPGGGDRLNTIDFRGTVSNPLENDYYSARLDHTLNDRWRFDAAIRYFREFAGNDGQISIIGGDIQSVRSFPVRNNMVTVGAVGQFKPNLIGEFRFGWVRTRTATLPLRPNEVASFLAIPGTSTPAGAIALDLGALGGTYNLLTEPIDVGTQVARKQANDNKNYQVNADMTWVRGTHTFQFGGHIRYLPTLHQRDDKVLGALGALVAQIDSDLGAFAMPASVRPPTCGGAITTNCLRAADVRQWNRLYASALGMIDNVSVLAVRDGKFAPLPFGSLLESDTKLSAPEFYFQDTWRVAPSLTLTLGLNYGWQTAPTERLGRYTFQINKQTGELLTSRDYLRAREQAARSGQIFNPDFAFMPINASKRKDVFDVDWNNVAPRISVAWNPSYNEGFLGALFGRRRTVIRGGYGLIYDRQNTVQSVIVPSLGVAFAQTLNVSAPACNATGSGGPRCNSGSANPAERVFRAGVDGTIPTPAVPEQSIPVSPFWGVDSRGRLTLFPEILSFQVDPSIEVGENHAVDFTWQRELPGNMLLELGYAGRFARKLPQSMSFGQVPYMQLDPASRQTFAQAFDEVATQLRSGVTAANVTRQPWFENQVPGGTAALVQAETSNFINGNLNSIFLTADVRRMQAGLAPFNNYMARTLFLRSSTGSSNYNAGLVTLRKRLSRGLTGHINYTFSKSLDQLGAIQNAASVMPNSFDLDVEYGPSPFDITHLFNGSWTYELPSPKVHPALGKILGGWYLSGIFTARSGDPLVVNQGPGVWGGSLFLGFNSGAIPTVNPGSFGNSAQRGVAGSNNVGTNSNAATGGSGLNLFRDPEAISKNFRRVLVSQDGRAGRANPLRGLPRWNLDFSLGKRTRIGERIGVIFSADFFNIFNKVDFADPSLDLTNLRAFGVITAQNTPANRTVGSRWIQLSLRVEF